MHARAVVLALLTVGAVLVGAVPASAITVISPRWVRLTPTVSPPIADRAPMAYDAATQQVILLDQSGGSTNGATWGWTGTTWRPFGLPPSLRPTPRNQSQMAYDPKTGQLILFGGTSPRGDVDYNDTWNWTGTGWQQLSPATSPPPTWWGSMAYDGATGQLLLFGGVTLGPNGFVYSNSTWSWNGSSWTQLQPATAPPARIGTTLAYDPATKQLLMFGGLGTSGTTNVALNDTWDWSGTNWVKLSPVTNPSARSDAAMAYDSTRQDVILSGGATLTGTAVSDTWEWSGSNWVRQSPAASLSPARSGATLVDDPPEGELLLFGGVQTSHATLGDTWAWTPLNVQTGSLPAGAVGSRYSATLQAVAGKAPVAWSVSSGPLPAGLSLSSTGVISGIPTAAGTVTFRVQVVDASPTPQLVQRSLAIIINPAPQPSVWVGNGLNSDINQFALTTTGTGPPMSTLSGPLTGVSGVGGLAFDSAGQLWASSSGGTAIEQFPPGATGNVAPSLVLAGSDTQLTTPAGIAFDSSGRLYVANTASQAITVYPAGASGDTPPLQTISGPDTGLSTPQGITVDRGGHIWVSNGGNSTLTEYAATAAGDAKPMNTIAGPATALNHPEGLGQDSAGDLLVANFFGGSVLTFADSGSFGDVAPKASIAGSQSELNSPEAVDVDTANRIYVADSEVGLAIFAKGSSTPAAVLTNSAIRAPGAVAVAPPLQITTGALARAALGRRYAGRLMAILGKAPLRWRRIRGRLPRGLKLAGNGHIAGTAAKTGRYRFTVKVTDSELRRQTAQASVTLTVGRAPTVTGMSRRHGSRRGGRTVTITGTGFSTARNATTVTFGRIRALRVSCRSSRRCTLRTPPGKLGAVNVTVTVGGLTSRAGPAARYRYSG